MEIVSWKEKMDEWHNNPEKLLAWITKLFWDAKINPNSHARWFAKDGKIIIGDIKQDFLNKNEGSI